MVCHRVISDVIHSSKDKGNKTCVPNSTIICINNCYDNIYCIKLKWLNGGILNQKFDMRPKVGNKKLKSS